MTPLEGAELRRTGIFEVELRVFIQKRTFGGRVSPLGNLWAACPVQRVPRRGPISNQHERTPQAAAFLDCTLRAGTSMG